MYMIKIPGLLIEAMDFYVVLLHTLCIAFDTISIEIRHAVPHACCHSQFYFYIQNIFPIISFVL